MRTERQTTIVVPMGNDFAVRLVLEGEVTQRRLKKLIAFIRLAVDEYPADVPSRPDTAKDGA